MTEADLTALLREHASRHAVPGAAIGILHDGAVTTAYCGVADVKSGKPVTSETRFSVGSLTKSMVATVIARLAGEGRLSLDDPAAAHVPELRGSGWAARATLRGLLANRSGLPLRAELEFSGLEGGSDDVLSRFASMVAAAEPTKVAWSYANAGWCLLGRAIETATGRRWEDAMSSYLFEPLQMARTTFANRPLAEARAAGHELAVGGPSPVEPWAPRCFGPAGSTVLSTVDDLLRLASLHLTDPALASLRASHAEPRIHGWLDGWCLGWARFDWRGGPVWGWDGVLSGQRAVLRLVPDQRAAVALLTNGSTGRPMYRSLFAELLETSFGVHVLPLMLDSSPAAAGDLSRYAGLYAWPDRQVEVVVSTSGLLLKSELGDIEALPVDERIFLVDAMDPDNPTVTFGAFDADEQPQVLYRMLWGLPRVVG
ncbi:MAG TPA: serine hydrolase domain-containing protein [Gaiellaceae bacterium]|nr:serine hydrolase domain-containing protein [Gaiellaceae bacterium]